MIGGGEEEMLHHRGMRVKRGKWGLGRSMMRMSRETELNSRQYGV